MQKHYICYLFIGVISHETLKIIRADVICGGGVSRKEEIKRGETCVLFSLGGLGRGPQAPQETGRYDSSK